MNDIEDMGKSDDPRIAALKRRMDELNYGEREVAELCGLTSRDAVTKWKSGASWPRRPTEEKLEQVLAVPRGFFPNIADGMTYEQAMLTPSSDGGEDDPTLALIRDFLAVKSFEDEKTYRIEEVQDHFRRQITMLVRMSCADPELGLPPDVVRRLRLMLDNIRRSTKKRCKYNLSHFSSLFVT